MPRLSWFTPLPPVKSGIAQYSCELLPALSSLYQIDVFVDRPSISPDERIRVFDAHDFLWKHRNDPYDLCVYQMGNAPCHDYMWAYLVRYPGLVVLHDGQLHHARARQLLQQKRYDDYRSEFRFNHPDADPDLAELGVEGLLGSMTYFLPVLRAIVESSRLVVVHNRWLADQIHEAHPHARIDAIDMGVPEASSHVGAAETIRRRHRIPDHAVVFLALGKVTPEKRILQAIRAMAALTDVAPDTHLLLAGEPVDYYDVIADATTLGVADRVTVAGFVDDADVDDYLAASDVCLCMRWPSLRETSASWLRCLAAGRPTITTDLAHTTDIPTLDPRNWSVLEARLKPRATEETPRAAGDEPRADGEETGPVGVSIDILDEDHSLQLAMRRLATDPGLRAILSGNARTLWGERFRLERMALAYRDVIGRALTLPSPHRATRPPLPVHLLQDGTEHAERLLREAGLFGAVRSDLWTGV
jgi:glycosyltransferase involved in cell wall biosynthesis